MPDPGVEIEILVGAQAFVDAVVFEQRAAAGANLVGMGTEVAAEHFGLAGGRFEQAEQQADGGGFPGAVWAEEAEHRSGATSSEMLSTAQTAAKSRASWVARRA